MTYRITKVAAAVDQNEATVLAVVKLSSSEFDRKIIDARRRLIAELASSRNQEDASQSTLFPDLIQLIVSAPTKSKRDKVSRLFLRVVGIYNLTQH